MDTRRLSKNRFHHWVSTGVTLLDFNASWCQPCRRQESILKRLEWDFSTSARVKIVNIDKNQDLALQLGIQSIPTIIIYKNGREIIRFIGLQSKVTLCDTLRSIINQAS